MQLRLLVLILLLVGPGLTTTAMAQEVGTCTTGEADAFLYVNNVRAQLFNNGNLFWAGGSPVYEVPKGEQTQAIFAASVWIGGLVNGSLRLAGSTYSRFEFWPGPLNDDGTIPNPDDCSAFDRIYEVSQNDIVQFEDTGTPPENLEQWPWDLGAPVIDGDGNPNNYNLAGGDRPALLGHQMQWWVMNDLGGPHERTQGQPLGMEVQVNAFAALSDDDAINNTTLYQYKLIYRGNAPLEDAYFGLFVDADLGNFDDDYVGVDSTTGLAFFYNADDNDEGGFGYGPHPPALGMKFVDGPVNAGGETLSLTNFITFMNGGGVTEDPQNDVDYYNYMQSRWKDGKPVTFGGNGRDFSETPTNFFFSGDPVTGAFWSELNTDGNGTPTPPHDRRFVMAAGPFTMQPGHEQVITLAIVWARGADHLDSITQLRAAAQDVQEAWDAGFDLPFELEPPSQAPALIAPADGATGQPNRLTLHWARQNGISGYDVQVATDAAFSNVVRSEHFPGSTAFDLEDLQTETTYYWRARSENPGGLSPWSNAFSFTTSDLLFDGLGPLFLSDGTPAFVEVVGPGGVDPCGAGATSTDGCSDVGGNGVYGSLNSTGDYVMYHLGSAGPEGTIGSYAPNDYEIRFTAEGSFGMHIFGDGRVTPVPFELWDIGPTPPGTPNDPSDDVQMIPALFAENSGTCTFGYGEVPASQSPLDLNWEGTERIYAFYPLTAYADWAAAVDSLVDNDPQRCPIFDEGTDFLDLERSRPLQRIVFFGNDSGAHFRPEGPPEGTIVRFYSTSEVHAPVLAAPEDGASDLSLPLTLWWNVQEPSVSHLQIATTPDFLTVVQSYTVSDDHITVNELASGSYSWRVRRIDGAGRPGAWSAVRQFSLDASKIVANEEETEIPGTYVLEQNYPNPFNPETTIRFALPQAGPVRLEVFDILGRRVATLFEGTLSAGWHSAEWQAQGVSSGVYLYRIEAGDFQAVERMLLLK